jgi:hypothetical protein
LAQSRDASSTWLAHPLYRSNAIGKAMASDANLQSAEAEISEGSGLAVPSMSYGTGDTISREHSEAVLSILTVNQREVF